MPVIVKPEDLNFPSPEQADEDGLIACGGKISAERLLAAYKSGIFPWPHDDTLLLWFCPDPRFVLSPQNIRINRSLRKALIISQLEIKADTNFLGVISQCRAQRMHEGTWITQEILDSYVELAQLGYAHSIEAYNNNILVGGLYGVSIGSIFFGESMFCTESYASKICLVSLAAHLIQWGFTLIDCQAHTDNLAHMGAGYIERKDFLERLAASQKAPTRLGPWHLNLSIREALSICKPS
jgi:leucyl/phenylalanyl-tRNA--protein transferase